jgi:hypothetical protein
MVLDFDLFFRGQRGPLRLVLLLRDGFCGRHASERTAHLKACTSSSLGKAEHHEFGLS